MCKYGVQYNTMNGLLIFNMAILLISVWKGEKNQYQTSRLQHSLPYFNASF